MTQYLNLPNPHIFKKTQQRSNAEKKHARRRRQENAARIEGERERKKNATRNATRVVE
jgi:hypothetical protein